MFRTDFKETWAIDIELVERFLVDFYNFYVISRRNVSMQSMVSEDSDCAPQTISVQRDPITTEMFKSLYGDRWRLKTFYTVRNLERNKVSTVRQRTHQLQQIMNIYNLTLQTNPDIAYERALRALQEHFIGPADTDPLTLDFVSDIITS